MENLNKYERLAAMNLEELRENAEALNTPATAFDILTLHKSLSMLSDEIREMNKMMYVEVENGTKRKIGINELILELYANQSGIRLRKTLVSLIKKNKAGISITVLIVTFLVGYVLGYKSELYNLFNLIFQSIK